MWQWYHTYTSFEMMMSFNFFESITDSEIVLFFNKL